MDREKIKLFYNHEVEKNRLNLEYFKLEGIRTKEIIKRYLRPDMKIVDIGGGAGFYSFWLQSLGYRVSMVDLSPRNIQLAKAHTSERGVSLTFCEVADAVALPFQDTEFDLALLLGPLYHLTNRDERVRAVREAKRVLKPGGVLVAAFISRYASLFDGLRRDLVKDKHFVKILLNDLDTGIHVNETDNLEYFTTSFFHTPAEMRSDLVDSGLMFEKLIGVESAGWLIENISEKMKDEAYWKTVQAMIEKVESNPDLIAMSPHVIGIARKN